MQSPTYNRQEHGLAIWYIISAVLCRWGGPYLHFIIPEKCEGEGTNLKGPPNYVSQNCVTGMQASSGIPESCLSGKRSHGCLAI